MKLYSETIISFSGGRSSAMMLKLLLNSCGGKFPDHVKVLFANTGKEHPATLDFVNECSFQWGIDITWLEYVGADKPQKRWKQVSYETASRNGEPFDALIKKKKYLPNPVKRFCTIELKIRVMKLYAQQVLGWKNWDVAIGFRADEPSRVAKLSLPHTEPFERFAPLYHLGITKHDVSNFWKSQGFDLNLPNNNGKTMHGNCTLCFLKGEQQTLSLIKEDPTEVDWWIEKESGVNGNGITAGDGALFRKDRPSYKELKIIAISQDDFFGFDDIEIECVGCTD